jgi:hypothetical protein
MRQKLLGSETRQSALWGKGSDSLRPAGGFGLRGRSILVAVVAALALAAPASASAYGFEYLAAYGYADEYDVYADVSLSDVSFSDVSFSDVSLSDVSLSDVSLSD